MSLNTDPDLITNVLSRLENRGLNEYIIAFGPEGRQFLATPNGYSA
jgi:methylenetetrahydrofolate dehydrogenase (NADP+)/methenyltetrahydrofolate cyclohydrolase/formyltetrahydrofolate synthetase